MRNAHIKRPCWWFTQFRKYPFNIIETLKELRVSACGRALVKKSKSQHLCFQGQILANCQTVKVIECFLWCLHAQAFGSDPSKCAEISVRLLFRALSGDSQMNLAKCGLAHMLPVAVPSHHWLALCYWLKHPGVLFLDCQFMTWCL